MSRMPLPDFSRISAFAFVFSFDPYFLSSGFCFSLCLISLLGDPVFFHSLFSCKRRHQVRAWEQGAQWTISGHESVCVCFCYQRHWSWTWAIVSGLLQCRQEGLGSILFFCFSFFSFFMCYLVLSDADDVATPLQLVLRMRNKTDPGDVILTKLRLDASSVGALRSFTQEQWQLLPIPAICRIFLRHLLQESVHSSDSSSSSSFSSPGSSSSSSLSSPSSSSGSAASDSKSSASSSAADSVAASSSNSSSRTKTFREQLEADFNNGLPHHQQLFFFLTSSDPLVSALFLHFRFSFLLFLVSSFLSFSSFAFNPFLFRIVFVSLCSISCVFFLSFCFLFFLWLPVCLAVGCLPCLQVSPL